MNLNDAFPSKYLKAGDLPDEGSETVTIEKIALEEIGRDRETKPVIYFEEFNKALVCNKTNGRTIARAVGSEEFDDWIGHKINLYRAEVEFQGEMVESIRVLKIGRSTVSARMSEPASKSVKAPPAKPAGKEEVEVDADGIPF